MERFLLPAKNEEVATISQTTNNKKTALIS